MLNLVVELGYVDIIVELGDVDIMDELGYIECACLILLDKLIELILHYKNCNMLVWMFDTNMLVGNTRLFYMIGVGSIGCCSLSIFSLLYKGGGPCLVSWNFIPIYRVDHG